MTCAFCGGRIDGRSILEHIVPIDVLLWTQGDMQPSDVNSIRHVLMRDGCNELYMHPECANHYPPNIADISSLHTDRRKCASARAFLSRIGDMLAAYDRLRQQVREQCGEKCAHCGKPVSAGKFVLTRVNTNGGYVPSNAKIVCNDCSVIAKITFAEGRRA